MKMTERIRYFVYAVVLAGIAASGLALSATKASAGSQIWYWEDGHPTCMWPCDSGTQPGCSCIIWE